MVERSIETKGSTPFSFRIFPKIRQEKMIFLLLHLVDYVVVYMSSYNSKADVHGSIVQLVRMLACHARGRGFESHPGRQ